MNFSNISYFLAIVEEGSISAAARKLYISQQALSEQLRKMEGEVGAPLLKRGKNFELTAAGQCLYRDGRELLRVYTSMMEDIQDVTTKRRKKITLGIPTFWTPPHLFELLLIFRQKYPEYEIAVVRRQHTDIEHNMNGVDLYFSALPLSPHLENQIILEHDPFHVSLRRSLAEEFFRDRWVDVEARLKETKSLIHLKELPFIALRDRYGQLVQSHTLIFNEYRMSPVFGFNSENFDLNEQACLNGMGCLLSTQSHADHFLKQDVYDMLTYPIHVTSFETKMAISHKKGLHLHTGEIRFLEEAASLFRNQE